MTNINTMTRLNRLMLPLTVACATLASGFGAKAQSDLFNSLGGSTIGNNGADITGGSGPLFASFSTTKEFTLTGVQLELSSLFDSPASFNVGIYSDNATAPGSLIDNLGTFNDSSLNPGGSLFTVTPSTPLNLDGGSRYWLGISGDNTAAAWSITTDTSGVGVANEYYSTGPSGVQPNSNGPFEARVYGDPVPEPTTTALVIAMAAIVGLSICKRRANRADAVLK